MLALSILAALWLALVLDAARVETYRLRCARIPRDPAITADPEEIRALIARRAQVDAVVYGRLRGYRRRAWRLAALTIVLPVLWVPAANLLPVQVATVTQHVRYEDEDYRGWEMYYRRPDGSIDYADVEEGDPDLVPVGETFAIRRIPYALSMYGDIGATSGTPRYTLGDVPWELLPGALLAVAGLGLSYLVRLRPAPYRVVLAALAPGRPVLNRWGREFGLLELDHRVTPWDLERDRSEYDEDVDEDVVTYRWLAVVEDAEPGPDAREPDRWVVSWDGTTRYPPGDDAVYRPRADGRRALQPPTPAQLSARATIPPPRDLPVDHVVRVAFGIGCALIAAAWVIGSVPVGLTGAVVAFLALMIPHLPHVDDWDRRVLGDDAAP